jgi:hypothetical protein
MIIDKEQAIEDFKNLFDYPLLGRALCCKIQEYKAVIAANIEEFKDIEELRRLVNKTADKWPKKTNDFEIEFEIVNIKGMWIPLLPGKKDFDPSRVIPGELVNYIVNQADKLDFGIIKRENNLTFPRCSGNVFNIWYEKIRDDYIFGIANPTKIEPESNCITDIDQIINEIKNMDYDKMREVFNLMFEDENFKREIFIALRVWKKLRKIDNKGL